MGNITPTGVCCASRTIANSWSASNSGCASDISGIGRNAQSGVAGGRAEHTEDCRRADGLRGDVCRHPRFPIVTPNPHSCAVRR